MKIFFFHVTTVEGLVESDWECTLQLVPEPENGPMSRSLASELSACETEGRQPGALARTAQQMLPTLSAARADQTAPSGLIAYIAVEIKHGPAWWGARGAGAQGGKATFRGPLARPRRGVAWPGVGVTFTRTKRATAT